MCQWSASMHLVFKSRKPQILRGGWSPKFSSVYTLVVFCDNYTNTTFPLTAVIKQILLCITVHTFDFSFLYTRRPNGVGHAARIVSNDINETRIDGECVVVRWGGPVHQSLCEWVYCLNSGECHSILSPCDNEPVEVQVRVVKEEEVFHSNTVTWGTAGGREMQINMSMWFRMDYAAYKTNGSLLNL